MSKGESNPLFTHQEKRRSVDLLAGLQEGGGDLASEVDIMPPPEAQQEGRLSGLHLLNNPWCPGHSGRNSDVTSGELADKPHGGFTGKLHLTLTSAAWFPVPPPSSKRVSGSLPGWAFIPFNREIGNEP